MALAIDSQESAATGHRATGSGTTNSWTFTNSAGNILLLGIVVTQNSGSAVSISTAPTYNSSAASGSLATLNWDTTKSLVKIYYWLTPATGANTISFAGSGDGANVASIAGAISFSGCDVAGTPLGTQTTGTAASGTHATAGAITTASGNYIVAFGGWGSGTGGTADASFTTTWLKNGSGSTAGDDGIGIQGLSSGGALTPGFTFTGSDQWGIVAVPVLAAAGAGGATTMKLPALGVG